MMCSRQQIGSTIVGPTRQHASHAGTWHRASIEAVRRSVRDVLPAYVHEARRHLNRRGARYRKEDAVAG
eukprot:2657381-Lingulodinium_polyedra.AAC.1